MQDLAVAIFQGQFQENLLHFQGLISMALLFYWISSFWIPLTDWLRKGLSEKLWFFTGIGFGLYLAISFFLDWGPAFTLVAFSLGMSIGLALIHPTIAVCLMTSLLFLRPWELIDKNDFFLMLPKLSFLLVVSQVIALLSRQKSLRPSWDWVSTFVLGFALWALVTTVKSGADAQRVYFDTFFKSCILYFVILNALKTKLDLRVLIGTVIVTFLGVGVVCIYQTMALQEAMSDASLRLLGFGAFGNSNDIAALMVFVFPFALIEAFRKEQVSRTVRMLSFLLLFVVFVAVYLSQSRAAQMALAAVLGFYFVLKIKNKWLTTAFVSLSILSVPVLTSLQTRDASDLQGSSASRMTYIKTGLIMGLKNPVFGVGFEGYQNNFEAYATEFLFEWGHRTAHNSWVLAFAETGFLGLILYVLSFGASVKFAIQIRNQAPEYLLCILGYGIVMTFLSHTYLLYPLLLYGIIGCANRIYREV